MISITPIYEYDGDVPFREYFQHKFVSQRLGRAKLWQGRGAKFLDLKNPITPTSFQNLLHGRSSDGAKQLRDPSAHGNKALAWWLTITAPPSLSVLWALAPRLTRARIQHAHFSAGRHALFRFQAAVNGWDRTAWETLGGRDRFSGAAFATFTSGATRDHSPQLQTNAFLFNMAIHRNGTVGTFTNDHVRIHKSELQKGYDEMLDAMRCGANGHAAPQELVQRFTTGSPFGPAKRAEQGKIVKLLQGSELFEAWQAQSKKWGWDPAEEFRFHPQQKRDLPQTAQKLQTALQRGRELLHQVRECLKSPLQAKQPQAGQSHPQTKGTKGHGHSHSH